MESYLREYYYPSLADAALNALLVPTEGMLGALHNYLDPNWLGEMAYIAMIRTAKEGA